MSIGVTAAVFDARKAKRLHSSSPRCDADDDDFRGPDDVVFLPKGGMAFTCGPLWLFKTGAQKTATQLEPAARRRPLARPRLRLRQLHRPPLLDARRRHVKSLDLT